MSEYGKQMLVFRSGIQQLQKEHECTVDAMTSQINSLEEITAHLRAQNSKLKVDLSTANLTISQLHDEISLLKKQNLVFSKKNSSALEEVQSLRKALLELQELYHQQQETQLHHNSEMKHQLNNSQQLYDGVCQQNKNLIQELEQINRIWSNEFPRDISDTSATESVSFHLSMKKKITDMATGKLRADKENSKLMRRYRECEKRCDFLEKETQRLILECSHSAKENIKYSCEGSRPNDIEAIVNSYELLLKESQLEIQQLQKKPQECNSSQFEASCTTTGTTNRLEKEIHSIRSKLKNLC